MNKSAVELSALFDDELEPHEFERSSKQLLANPANSEAWHTYALIQDQLKGEPVGSRDLLADVMARVREEPVVFSPRPLSRKNVPHPLLALAASIAGVVVVGWLALAGDGRPSPPDRQFAAVAPPPTFVRADGQRLASAPVQPTESRGRSERADLSEYLLAHHAHAPTFRLGDGVQHVRTVSAAARPER